MKLSHRDFRPPRRSKYVSQPPRRRPTLRILLLGILGVIVYLKFDTLAASPAWRGLKQPRSLLDSLMRRAQPPSPASSMTSTWSPDSQSVSLACPSRPESCLGPGFLLGSETAGVLRGLLEKARLQLDADDSQGFTAALRRPAGAPTANIAAGWEVIRLELRGVRGITALEPEAGNPASVLCVAHRCLDAVNPQAPFQAVRRAETGFAAPAALGNGGPEVGRIPFAILAPKGSGAVRPVLSGRVVSMPVAGDSLAWLKIHHGRDLYSYYRGWAHLDSSLRAGAMVGITDTMGWVADSAGLELRIERKGIALDPIVFLGLPAAGEVARAR